MVKNGQQQSTITIKIPWLGLSLRARAELKIQYFDWFYVFTDWVFLARSVIELPCPSVCLSVCMCVPSQNTHFRVSRKLLVKGHIANIGPQSHHFCIVLLSVNFGFLNFPGFFFQASLLWTSLLWIMGELVGGLCLWLLALVTYERWQVTGDRWQVTGDTRHVTCYIWHLFFVAFFTFMYILVLVLLSESIEQVMVSHMWDIFCSNLPSSL